MDVRVTLVQFDQYLLKQRETFEVVVIGGAALNLMGVITRDTVDVDCLDPKIPENILKLAKEFSLLYPEFKRVKNVQNHFEILKKRLSDGKR